MCEILKKTYYYSLDFFGQNRRAFKRKWPSITILTYHSVVPDDAPIRHYEYRNAVTVSGFDEQIKLLTKYFKIISLTEALERLEYGKLQANYVVITFDDGYWNNYQFAFPVLKRHNVPAAFFVTTSLIGTQECLWTDWVTFIFFKTESKQFELNYKNQNFSFKLDSMKDRIDASEELKTFMKSLPFDETKSILEKLKQITQVTAHPVFEDRDRYAFMNWSHVREMAQQGMEIGSHTHTHALLSMLNNQTVEYELALSKRLIEQNTDQKCLFFAYPNGQERDFNEDHISILRQLGFKSALTQIPGFVTIQSNLYRLPRINITNQMSIPVFKAYVWGSKVSRYHQKMKYVSTM